MSKTSGTPLFLSWPSLHVWWVTLHSNSYICWFIILRWNALFHVGKGVPLWRRTSETLILNQSMFFFDFLATTLTPFTRYHFYLRFLRKLEEKAPNWTLKMREKMYQQVLWADLLFIHRPPYWFLVYSEDCNMSYLLHVENALDSAGSNPVNEAIIDVDYDALEASI